MMENTEVMVDLDEDEAIQKSKIQSMEYPKGRIRGQRAIFKEMMDNVKHMMKISSSDSRSSTHSKQYK